MTDRELLELAAKACGYDTSHPWNAERLTLDPPVFALCIDGVSTGWNPLSDDGHALRLAVKLQALVSQHLSYASVCFPYGPMALRGQSWCEHYKDDPCAATRRAIVRAAAEIGRTMP